MSIERIHHLFVLLALLMCEVTFGQSDKKCCRKLDSTVKYINNRLKGKINNLENNVFDLKADLQFERERWASLFNETQASNPSTDADITSTGKLEADVKEQRKELQELTKKTRSLMVENGRLKTRVDDIDKVVNNLMGDKGEPDIKRNLQEVATNITGINKVLQKLEKDTTQIKRNAIVRNNKNKAIAYAVRKAFRDEKLGLHKFKKTLQNEIEHAWKAVNESGKTCPETTGDVDMVLAKIDKVNFELNMSRGEVMEMKDGMSKVKNDVAIIKGQLTSTVDRLGKMKECCRAVDELEELTGCCRSRAAKQTGTTAAPPSGLPSPVTLTPGGPWIYPVYGEALRRHIKIGSRVVRGRDWSWRNQDGGGPGTVDAWYNKDRSEVYVTWDHGEVSRANYRIGLLDKYDLYLLAKEGVAPTDSSGMPSPVTLTPGGPRIYPVYGQALKKLIKIGSRVVRGRDWAWRNQDGGGPGTVDAFYADKSQVYVTWDRGTTKRANYRIGAHNKYDLYLLAE